LTTIVKLAKLAKLMNKYAPEGIVDLFDGTFNNSNPGPFRVDQFTMTVKPSHAAILAERIITMPLSRFLLTIIINV
jgi:pyruvate/2-oxoglutarate dehydrogenase complex dihydrolipoamide acyltransferase (E2) component